VTGSANTAAAVAELSVGLNADSMGSRSEKAAPGVAPDVLACAALRQIQKQVDFPSVRRKDIRKRAVDSMPTDSVGEEHADRSDHNSPAVGNACIPGSAQRHSQGTYIVPRLCDTMTGSREKPFRFQHFRQRDPDAGDVATVAGDIDDVAVADAGARAADLAAERTAAEDRLKAAAVAPYSAKVDSAVVKLH
jgi:hypothetical protein